MGRKGGGKKAFLKGVVAKPDAEDAAPLAVSETAAEPAEPESQRAAASQAASPSAFHPVFDHSLDAQQLEAETRGQLTQRHKKEAKTMKETVKRLGKKKKDEAQKLEEDMDQRHAAELASLEQRESDAAGPQQETVSILNTDLYSFSLAPEETQKNKQPTKAQKRRAHQAEKEADREAELEAERAHQGESAKDIEAKQLQQILSPLGLTIREIQPDGHCMYRAIQDQLDLHSDNGADGQTHVSELRQKTADYIRTHKEEFLPFLVQELDQGDADSSFEEYCNDIASTAAWGGQTELNAVAQVLQHHIKVYAAGLPVVSMGQQFEGATAPSLAVCYLRHAFGLGEHYNSVIPGTTQSDSDDSEGFVNVSSDS